MGFFDDVKATVTSAGREVGDKAKEIAESSKIKNAIAQDERSLNAAYVALSKKYMKQYGENPDAAFEEDINKIRTFEAAIAEKKEELEAVKNA